MFAKFVLITLAAMAIVACSDSAKPPGSAQGGACGLDNGAAGTSGAASPTGDQTLIVPDGLAVTPRPGINSVFSVSALTLQSGPNGAELYAAVRNDGCDLACNASFSVELRDKDDQVLGTGISGLSVRRFYEFTDGSGTIAGCVAGGDVTKVAITSLALDNPLEDVKSVVYQSNYWGDLKIAPVAGVSLRNVRTVSREGGTAYSGTLVNGLDTPLTHPTAAIFPTNAVGRPLAVAYAGSDTALALPPGGTWDFETSTVSDPGVGYDAYPMGGP